MLLCDNVVKKYRSCTAVDHVNVRIDDGRVYAMLGPNGSGKTTLMKMIMGLICPTEGTISINGVPMSAKDKAKITYMPTENYFYSYMTIKDIVGFYKDFYDNFSEEHFYDLMNKMGLSFPDKVKNMSTGMLAKLKVAVALARHSDITMLDEPLNGIDILAREVIIRAIMDNADGKRTFIISSHLVDELETVVDSALFMKGGKMVLAGEADKLRASNGKSLVDLYKEVYGWGVPYAQPMYGMPNGMPYGQPNGMPYGQPNRMPYGQPNGMPYGQPYGQPNGMPYGQPNGMPYGQPNGMPYGQPGSIPNEPPKYEMPATDKYDNPYVDAGSDEGKGGM